MLGGTLPPLESCLSSPVPCSGGQAWGLQGPASPTGGQARSVTERPARASTHTQPRDPPWAALCPPVLSAGPLQPPSAGDCVPFLRVPAPSTPCGQWENHQPCRPGGARAGEQGAGSTVLPGGPRASASSPPPKGFQGALFPKASIPYFTCPGASSTDVTQATEAPRAPR